ncbi:ABC transporter ATP-binding protein [Blastococcus sp. TBT05-19]|nr:ABC transporter ATP-binding protein [Blastococcus sp. TBT05-19]
MARVVVRPHLRAPDAWFWDLPAVARLRTEGLDLAPVTVLVGENGSGKSTLVEAVARAWQRSLTAAVKHWGPLPSPDESELWAELELRGEHPRPQGGAFLRAEAMHAHFSSLDEGPAGVRAFGGPLHTRSHGEGFLAFLEERTTERGLWILDEPESALSFRSCLRLLVLLDGVVAAGSQVLLATHSPLLAAVPGALVYELDDDGFTPREWADLDLVRDWQAFLGDPTRLLGHLLGD